MKWTLDDSRLVYGVARNDLHFLDITPKGELCVSLEGSKITLKEIIRRVGANIREAGYTRAPSFTLRIPQLLSTQVEKISGIFQRTIKQQKYQGKFRAVYPMKVNPRFPAVKAIIDSSKDYGLEVGTKSELYIVLKMLGDDKGRLIMCNGVKDEEYIEIVRQALDDSYKVWISIESIKEAQIALERIPKTKLKLAFRVKPYTSILSHWGTSAGRDSKFGLAIHDILALVKVLKQAKAESTVVAIHGHPGGQVLGNIFSFGEYMARVYTHLRDLGLTQLTVVNLGGGLPINYDNHLAPDVTESYILALVKALKDTIADKHPHPDIMTEGGRCLTALYALLVIRTFDLRHIFPDPLPGEADQARQIITNMLEDTADPLAVLAAWRSWQKTRVLYKELPDLLEYERLSGTTKQQLRQKFVQSPNYEAYTGEAVAKDLLRAEHILLGNFSVFNGACDHVLVGQYFPIIPINHLHKQPETLVRLVDITCDSDGEISTYHPPISAKSLFTKDGFPLTTTNKQTWKGFPIGDLESAPDSYLVIGLVGAYQDIIEMDHNLVGDLPDVELTRLSDGEWEVKWLGAAQTIQDLVSEVGYTLPQLKDPYID